MDTIEAQYRDLVRRHRELFDELYAASELKQLRAEIRRLGDEIGRTPEQRLNDVMFGPFVLFGDREGIQ